MEGASCPCAPPEEVAPVDQAHIGDDRLQKRARGFTSPENYTHGTSAQRVKWFRKGYETGDLREGDTFSARDL